MPKVSGIEVLCVMRNDPELKQIPALMLTSSRGGPDLQECDRLGADAYVVKPLEFQAFFEAVKAVGRFWGVLNELPQNGEEARSGRVTEQDQPVGKA